VKTRLLLILSALLLAACGSDAIKPTPLKPITASLNPQLIWDQKLGSDSYPLLSTLVLQGKVYAANRDGDLYALDLESGKVLWKASSDGGFSSGVGSSGSGLVLGNRKGDLISFDFDGKLQWKVRLGSEVSMTPAGAEGLVLAVTADGRINGLSATDGTSRWQVTRQIPALTLRNAGGISVERGAAFVSMPGGKLLGIDLKTGNVGWESSVSLPKGATELERMNDTVGAPLLEGDMVCAVSYQGRAGCFNAQRGAQLWTHEMATVGPITQTGNKIVGADERGNILAWNQASGTQAWKNEELLGRFLSAPGHCGDLVVVGDVEGVVHFISRADGMEVGRFNTRAGDPINTAPRDLGDDRVLVQNQSRLYVIRSH
jgi:outer membrane protein assembly factor BamB